MRPRELFFSVRFKNDFKIVGFSKNAAYDKGLCWNWVNAGGHELILRTLFPLEITIHSKGLPYMLERAGLDVQQGKEIEFSDRAFSFLQSYLNQSWLLNFI